MKNLIAVLVIIFSHISYSQTFNVSGIVRDNEQKILCGVNVIIQGSDKGDATGSDGSYAIKDINKGQYTIHFSCVGFRSYTQELAVNNDIVLNVTLETQIVNTEQVIVSAGKYEQKFSDLPVSAAVLQGRDILKYNYDNLRDALKYVPGLNMMSNQLSIRGSSGYTRGVGARVLMTVEGFPFYTADAGEIKWETVPVNEIERVEIIKGASSSLYGSTAIGGIINVLTREINQPSTHLSTYIGAYDKPSHEVWDWSNRYQLFHGQSISHSNVFGKVNLTASFTRREDQGYRKNDFNERYIGYLKTGYKFNEKNSMSLLFNTLHQYSGNYNYWKDSRHALEPPDFNLGETITSSRYMVGLISRNNLSSSFELTSRASYYKTNWTNKTKAMDSSDADQYRIDVQGNLKVAQNFIVINGVELSYNTVTANLFGNNDAISTGIYSQGDYVFSFPLTITGGVRFDYTSTNGTIKDNALSPRLGLNYKLNNNITLRAMAGSGFRAPSLAEMFTSTNVSGIRVKPNPNLKSENNLTFETGILYYNSYFDLDGALFRNEFYDMIELAINLGDGSATFSNLVRSRIQGAELNFSSRLFDIFLFSLGYTFMDTKDLNKGTALKYRPKHMFNASLALSENGFEAGVNFRYMSKFEEIDWELVKFNIIPDGDHRSEMYVFDANAGYNFVYSGFPLRAYINLKNIFNYYYIEVIGNLAPLRNIALNLELFL